MTRYTILLLPEDDGSGYTVECPALPGLVSFGETREQALDMAHEAITGYLKSVIARGLGVPAEIHPPELATVEVEIPSVAEVFASAS